MVTRKLIVKNNNGLHLRVAAELVKICRQHNAEISFSCNGCPKADGCSVLSLLMLNAAKGSEVTISARGSDAVKAIASITNYFESGGGI